MGITVVAALKANACGPLNTGITSGVRDRHFAGQFHMALPSSLGGVAFYHEVLPLNEAETVQFLEKSAVKPTLVGLMSPTLVTEATKAMRFVGCCASACRIADAIIRPATKSRRFIDHLVGDSEQG